MRRLKWVSQRLTHGSRSMKWPVGWVGIEPTTLGLRGPCSTKLSYQPASSLTKGLMYPYSESNGDIQLRSLALYPLEL